MSRKVYRLKSGVRLISCRSDYGRTAAIWPTGGGGAMNMPRDQVAAWLRTARRENYIEAIL